MMKEILTTAAIVVGVLVVVKLAKNQFPTLDKFI